MSLKDTIFASIFATVGLTMGSMGINRILPDNAVVNNLTTLGLFGTGLSALYLSYKVKTDPDSLNLNLKN
jgi:hypothetical protein